ncbi:Trp family transcriptional regulator [Streptomyces sp. TRM68416]|uniref:Trp family transcriptional regulator n=1 Tax=Streptomyces sp. TRM68416 TaxID=2758412 RepID=UPI0016620C1A|nr:Trp family transcriptional regulator [Streptomyces sp. TRM68416]MBD0837390.1 hypothetical protein [Streptomyces sp. TRM68416]
MTAVRDDVAALLHAGHTYRQIMRELGVSNHTIIRTRRTLDIPLPPGRAKHTPAERAAIDAQALVLLRAGATTQEIRSTLRISPNRICHLRKQHHIPVPHRDVWAGQRRTIDEAFTLHTRPTASGGHLLWTGPRSGRGLDLIASGRKHNARHIAFHKHHGREPQGRVWRTCNQPDCIAGAHHTDALIRQAHKRADKAFPHIFGTDA